MIMTFPMYCIVSFIKNKKKEYKYLKKYELACIFIKISFFKQYMVYSDYKDLEQLQINYCMKKCLLL